MRTLLLAFALLVVAACDDVPDIDESRPPVVGNAEMGHKFVLQRCVLCHLIEGKGNTIAPPMVEAIAKAEKLIGDYPAHVDELKKLSPKTYTRHKLIIDKIANEPDSTKRFTLWLNMYLRYPQFDDPAKKMAGLVLDEQDYSNVIAWVLSQRAAK